MKIIASQSSMARALAGPDVILCPEDPAAMAGEEDQAAYVYRFLALGVDVLFSRDLRRRSLDRAFARAFPGTVGVGPVEPPFTNISRGLPRPLVILQGGSPLAAWHGSEAWLLPNEQGNRTFGKVQLARAADQLGIPVIAWELATPAGGNACAVAQALQHNPAGVLLQRDLGCGGQGTTTVGSTNECWTREAELNAFGQGVLSAIYPHERIEASVSIGCWTDSVDSAWSFACGQLVLDFTYAGSFGPVALDARDRRDMRRIVSKVAVYLGTKMYRGPYGLDLLKIDGQWRLVDLNVRLPGSYFPWHAWASRAPRTRERRYWCCVDVELLGVRTTEPERAVHALSASLGRPADVSPLFGSPGRFMYCLITSSSRTLVVDLLRECASRGAGGATPHLVPTSGAQAGGADG